MRAQIQGNLFAKLLGKGGKNLALFPAQMITPKIVMPESIKAPENHS
jgi:hypothetical protein